MADLTLTTNNVALKALDRLPNERNGRQRSRSRRFRRLGRHTTIVQNLFPGAAPDHFEVYMELVDGRFIGVAVIDTHSGEVVTHVSLDELTEQAEHPGLFFERAA